MYKKLVWWIAVIAWMIVIFSFSAQPAKESNELSTGVVRKIVEFVNRLDGMPVLSMLGENSIEKLIVLINHTIRKIAHFSIFAVLGVLVYGLLNSYNVSRKRIFLITVSICLLYAASDEIHQCFVPGRAGRFTDVLIDTSGSFVATALVHIVREKIFVKA